MPHIQTRRIGWIAVLAVCAVLYLMIVLNGNSVRSEVVRAERKIVSLEQQNMLLETEYLTRSSQAQLARWNRVDFGYSAPTAAQFIQSERELAVFGGARGADAPEPIRLAGAAVSEETRAFPQLVSPMTGQPVGGALDIADQGDGTAMGGPLEDGEDVALQEDEEQSVRIPLDVASASSAASLEAVAR